MGGSIVAMNFVVSRQAMWLEAIEKRISATSSMLAAMKGIKMSGLKETLFNSLQQLRVDELRISKKFRKLLIWNMAFGKLSNPQPSGMRNFNSPDLVAFVTQIFAPIITFALFSFLAQDSGSSDTLDTARVFTSLSLFALLAEPLASLIMALVAFMGSVGCFTRIQEFLEKEARIDTRQKTLDLLIDEKSESSIPQNIAERMSIGSLTHKHLSLAFKEVPQSSPVGNAITVQDGRFGWDPEKDPLLKHITMTVPRQKLTILVGPVGCGKSTLLKALLGEVPTMGGVVRISSKRIAYCDQTPWHMNQTIRQSIIAVLPFDESWYTTVIRACALEEDLNQIPRGDQTIIGSQGVALSGGQSQRIVS